MQFSLFQEKQRYLLKKEWNFAMESHFIFLAFLAMYNPSMEVGKEMSNFSTFENGGFQIETAIIFNTRE